MKLKPVLFAMCPALATPTVAQDSGEAVTPSFKYPNTSISGERVTDLVVDYAPADASPSHSQAKSAFTYDYVVSGAIKTQL
jgi:hypothetical protein